VATISLYSAIKKMRQLTEYGIPFSFEFYSHNSTKGTTGGLKKVDKALLRQGFRRDKSDKADILIGYTNYQEATDRFFYLPLLMKFNGLQIIP
jgi:hypothetical protein